MIIARFEFLPEAAPDFAWLATQQIVEMQFEDLFEFFSYCEPIEDALKECTVYTGEEIISLSDFTVT